MSRLTRFFRHGGTLAWALIGAVFLTLVGSTFLLGSTAEARYRRDVSRMVFNDNVQLLERVRSRVGVAEDTLKQLLTAAPEVPSDAPYLVVSIEERKLWYKQGDSVLFETQVATGSGKSLVKEGSAEQWKFETPRGRLVVISKDSMPAWVPPDWHFVEQARKRGLGLLRLNRGQEIPASDGSVVTTSGTDIVKRYADGREVPLQASDGREIVVNGNLVIPPFGTNQRKYKDVLGTRRLNIGDGYALHGTNNPASIGQAVSHGCVRLRNADIERLYDMVPVGTTVYIY
jgi:hypothetical protein